MRTAMVHLNDLEKALELLGVKSKPRTDKGRAVQLRRALRKKGWRVKCKWDAFGERMWECWMEKNNATRHDLPLLQMLAPHATGLSVPISLGNGMVQYFNIDGEVKPGEDPFGMSGKKPQLTTGSKAAIVDAILKLKPTELILLLGIHPYLDAAIEQKLKRRKRSKAA